MKGHGDLMFEFIDKIIHTKKGIALGGGGARGAAHIGALKALEEYEVELEAIAGTSGGAIVAALYAFNVTHNEMISGFKSLKGVDLRSLKIGSLGLVENTPLANLIDKCVGNDMNIEQANIPLAIHATDIETGESIIIKKGPLKNAVLASCCVPGFYIPQEIEGRLLVDGGLTENVPLSALDELGVDFSIAVNLNGNFAYAKPSGILDIATNAMDIAIDLRTKEQIERASMSVNLSLAQYSRKSTIHTEALVEEGYKQTQEQLEKLLGD
jgi:NTE family protein